MAEQALSIEQRLHAALNPAPEAPPEKAAPQPQAAPQPAQAQEPDDDYVPSTDGAQEADEAVAQQENQEDSDDWFPERIDELAQAIGHDPARLYGLKLIATGDDGKPTEVTIGQLKDAYAERARLQKTRREQQEQAKESEAEKRRAIDELHRKTVEINGLAEAAMQRLMAKYQGTNWEQLRSLDPAEWAAKRAEMQEEFAHIQNIRNGAMMQAQQQMQQQQVEQTRQYQQYLAEQEAEARRLIPEFSDAEKAPKFKESMITWMKGQGFSDYEMSAVSNSAKLLKAVRTEMTLAGTDTAAKKVPNNPKRFIKPGAAQARGSKEAEAYKAARSKLRKSGKVEDAAAIFRRVLGG